MNINEHRPSEAAKALVCQSVINNEHVWEVLPKRARKTAELLREFRRISEIHTTEKRGMDHIYHEFRGKDVHGNTWRVTFWVTEHPPSLEE